MDGDNFENFTISNSLKTIQINSIVPFYIIKKLLPGMIKIGLEEFFRHQVLE